MGLFGFAFVGLGADLALAFAAGEALSTVFEFGGCSCFFAADFLFLMKVFLGPFPFFSSLARALLLI